MTTPHSTPQRGVDQWGEYVLVVNEALRDSVRTPLASVPTAEREGVLQELHNTGYAVDDELWRLGADGQRMEPPWPMAIVFDNLIIGATELLVRREQRLDDKALHHDEINKVVDGMESVAERWPYAGPHRKRLEQLAADIKRDILEWPARFFRRAPRDPKRLLELRTDALLWTIRELRRAVLDASEAWGDQRPADYEEGLWAPFRQIETTATNRQLEKPAVLAVIDADVGNLHNLQARADRLPARISAGKEHDLIASVLRDALTYGPFLPDGTRRH